MKARNNDFLAKYENYPLRNEIQEGILLQSVCVYTTNSIRDANPKWM